MQVVEIVQESAKLDWLVQKLPAMIDNGEVLVFANMIARVEEIAVRIQSIGHRQSCYLPQWLATIALSLLL